MATTEERFCHDDTDCSEKQYCYQTSERCVNYTQCSLYNRHENSEIKSRYPSQCGPCFSGYNAEKLATGEMTSFCKKIAIQQSIPEINSMNNYMIFISLGAIVTVCVTVLILRLFFRQRSLRQQGSNSNRCDIVSTTEPTAPPLENSPFINHGQESSRVPFNNNKNLKDKNNLVRATGFLSPNWVRPNPNYENNLSNENMNAVGQLHPRSEVSSNDHSNNWSPEQLTVEVTGAHVRYQIEQADNSLNTILAQTNNTSSTQEDNDNNNNNNNNNNGSTSESNSAQNGSERTQPSNILISQKISMNVNVVNGN
ncbi:uncharacterized protein LOC143428936 [Xylocopa sonorina]|uniref:uncharacterized protein LOC143428936 n=1 Tax=Xylocopa sonorina TaxID=1818115 RepID=UPI00403AE84A